MTMEALALKTALSIGTSWDLAPANRALSKFQSESYRMELAQKVNELGSMLKNGLRPPNATLPFHRELMEVDNTLHAIHCAFDLKALSGQSSDGESAFGRCYASLSHDFSQLIDEYIVFITSFNRHVPNLVQKWVNAMTTPCPTSELQQGYSFITSEYESTVERGSVALSKRSLLDPEKTARDYRLRENQLNRDQVDYTTIHQAESQTYFNRLLSETGRKSALLSEVRDVENSRYSVIQIPLEDALSTLRRAFEQCNPECLREVDDVLANRRLRFCPDPSSADLCFDTPFGSYVQLHFDGGLTSAVKLAHEMGHAVHQYLHRCSENACLPLNVVDSETWALDFETTFINRLGVEQPELLSSLFSFNESHRIEMNHRHRMLHSFELALHGSNIRSVSDINDLWLAINRTFYGPNINFEAGFEKAWMEIHHLFTAPFYLMIYGIAKERADTYRPTQSINRHYPNTNKELACT